MLAAAAVAVFAPAWAATAAAALRDRGVSRGGDGGRPGLPWTRVQPSTQGNSNDVLASVAVLSSSNVCTVNQTMALHRC